MNSADRLKGNTVHNGETDQTELEGGRDLTAPRESAGYARSLLEASLDPLVTISPEGKITDVNEATVRVTGHSREQLIGTDFSDYFTDPKSARQGYQEVFAKGSVTDYPLTIRGREGKLTDVLYNASLYKDQRGNVLGVFAAARDVTERKRAEELVRASEERYRTLFDSANDAVFLHDLDGRILEVNSVASERLGYARDELASMNVTEIRDATEAAHYAAQMEKVRSQGRTVFETTHRRRDGSTIPVEVSNHMIEDAGREVVLSIARDVSERKRMEEELVGSEEHFRALIENSSDLVAVIDGAGIFEFQSPSSERILGYRPEELVGRNVFDFTHPDDAGLSQGSFAELVRGERSLSQSTELRFLHKDGSWRVLEVKAHQLPGRTGEVSYVLNSRDVTERKQAEQVLSLTRFSLEKAADPVHWLDPEGRILDANESSCRRYGYSREEMLGLSVFDLDPELPRDIWPKRWEEIKKLGSITLERMHRTKEGELFPVEVTSNHIEHGGREYDVVFLRDITERKRAEDVLRQSEEQLRQAQKMEAVGQLAGGIAHDFNNVLTSIIGYSDLVLASEECADSSLRDDVREIKAAAERASALTRQILAFSRRQALRPEVLSLNDVLESMERLLRRTLGEDIDLVSFLDLDLGLVEVDANQLGQVLVNLALNARDAMRMGGRLTLETANVELSQEDSRDLPGLIPGRYVMLAVSDTGVGMDEGTRSHVFEPFFTTKEPGKGTGLGLATVYGVVKQSGGCVFVRSELGQGATFKVYLPRVEKPAKQREGIANSPDSVVGHETILVVEDEAAVRELVRRVLERLGYTVLTVGTGDGALIFLEETKAPVELLLTDVVLPGTLQGNELARAAGVLRPSLPVLYMSGYTRDTIVHSGRLDEGVNYLEKPFTADQLARRVREVLDSHLSSR